MFHFGPFDGDKDDVAGGSEDSAQAEDEDGEHVFLTRAANDDGRDPEAKADHHSDPPTIHRVVSRRLPCHPETVYRCKLDTTSLLLLGIHRQLSMLGIHRQLSMLQPHISMHLRPESYGERRLQC